VRACGDRFILVSNVTKIKSSWEPKENKSTETETIQMCNWTCMCWALFCYTLQFCG